MSIIKVSLKPHVSLNRKSEACISRAVLTSCRETGIDDDITRRDSMHAIINSLPDPNYATLRTLTLVSKLTVRLTRSQCC